MILLPKKIIAYLLYACTAWFFVMFAVICYRSIQAISEGITDPFCYYFPAIVLLLPALGIYGIYENQKPNASLFWPSYIIIASVLSVLLVLHLW